MRGRFVLMALALLLAQTATPALAFHGAALGDGELDAIHAGFSTADGLSMTLGAVMRSYVDGSLVLQSTMSVNASGITSTQQVGANARPLDAADMAALPALAQAGAVLAGPGGNTTFVQSLSNNGLTNMVVNTADNRNIVQSTSVTVMIPNLQALEQQAMLAGFATQLHDMLGSGLIGASPH